jgi:hypothetical protein
MNGIETKLMWDKIMFHIKNANFEVRIIDYYFEIVDKDNQSLGHFF